MAPDATLEMTGREKAAILLITLGPEKSAKIFKHLKEEEIEQLTLEIANTSLILPEVKERVLEEFYNVCVAQQYITEGGLPYARSILEKAMGSDRAYEIISKLTMSLKVRPFDFVRKADPTQILNFIQNEHPQVIALILAYLRPAQAAAVLAELSPEKQADVAKRIAIMNSTSPDVIKEVERVLEKKLSSLMTDDFTHVGGVDSVVEILNAADRATEKNILETLEVEEAELSEEIKKKMFVFEDIVTLDSRSVRRILMQTDSFSTTDLATALKGAPEAVKDVVLANVSKRMAAMIQEEMDFLGPVRKGEVDEAQQKIVNVIRHLQETNEIIIARGGGDELIV